MSSPRIEHWKAVKWVLRYLNGTFGYGMVYGSSDGKNRGLWGFVYSDFAGDIDRRRSLTSYMYMLNGCLIKWKVSHQYVVALSTTKADYTTATKVVRRHCG